MDDFRQVVELVRQHEVGRRATIRTPFGPRLVTYADLTATGRFLHFVEAWFRHVQPFYANTHTAISSTGRLMSGLREQARAVIARAVHAGPEHVVVFVGSGATAAVNKLVGLLGLRIPEPLEREFGLSRHIPPERRPVVLVGPYEHHSNELPWLETIAEVIEVPLSDCGRLDVDAIGALLAARADRPLRLGAFSAASNVTGVLTDVGAVARALHRAGAWACFDYAAAAPYVPIDMRPADPEERIDALFVSTHKFVGGPGGSGVLVAHRDLFRSRIPERPGGGTVDYVAAFDRHSVDYVRRLDEREEGGTPNILGDLRAGAAFLVKELLGPTRILEHDVALARTALERLGRHPRIRLYGPRDCPRLPVLSFNVHGLHHGFVAVLLDHLFGIQNRPGCSCAGPYGHQLLGIGPDDSARYRAQIARGLGGIKPGWVRLTLPYYGSTDDVDFLLSAVEFVAERGADFLPLYRFGWREGTWVHVAHPVEDAAPLELSAAALRESASCVAAGDHEAPLSEAHVAAERRRYFEEARRAADELRGRTGAEPPAASGTTGERALDELVWFRYVHSDDAWREPPPDEPPACPICGS
ncbi:MAG: aminotransferase class V-fold PLP-dependent enzyme [Deltaproteobacteria bacterium]|nr:aminotransferase class V-fold PLP-dependent enzyme [Deltaproteobacteria bacterium]